MNKRITNLQSRIRELDRAILHCKDKTLRTIYKDHKQFLMSEVQTLQKV